MNMIDKEFKFFCDWYFRAQLDENYDADRQFFYFYALFDHLFKSYAEEQKDDLEAQGLQLKNSERSKMRYFLYSYLYTEKKHECFKNYNPFATLQSCKQNRIIEKLKAKNVEVFSKDYDLPSFESLVALFEEIYDIRCNLFHGSSDLSDSTNNKLIDEANIVLKDFLKRLFDKAVHKEK